MILVIGLAYGDCGKGSIVDFLVRRNEAHTVVRFNGGPQAGHNVVTGDGRHHTFSQFGSGTFVPGVRTLLSRYILIEPYAMFNEAAHLAELGVPDAFDRLLIDERCPVITPAHQAANRLRELARGDAAHGTCGMGVGELMQDLNENPDLVLHAGELGTPDTVNAKVRAACDLKACQLVDLIDAVQSHPKARLAIVTLMDRSWIDVAVETYAELARQARIVGAGAVRDVLSGAGTLVFEGAQGLLLDQTFGCHPHTTWSTTTFANAEALLNDAGHTGRRTRIGVLRSYFTRHGPGPFVTEDDSLRERLSERHNDDTGWQGRFRVGVFDCVAARYAASVAGPIDCLAITHLDRVQFLPPVLCTAYTTASNVFCTTTALNESQPVLTAFRVKQTEDFLALVLDQLKLPLGIASFGPTADDKRVLLPGLRAT